MARDWVPDTAFGRWFLSTDMWLQRVLARAIADLKQLAGTNAPDSFNRLMDVGCGQGRVFSLLQKTFSPGKSSASTSTPTCWSARHRRPGSVAARSN